MAVARLLFVCVENACRSQMAEGFARRHGAGRVEAWSAGSRPAAHVNPAAVAMMRERGIDLATARCRSLDEVPDVAYEAVVTMGCGDACPHVRARRRIDWSIPDPRAMPPEPFRAVRDTIERAVLDLLRSLGEGRV